MRQLLRFACMMSLLLVTGFLLAGSNACPEEEIGYWNGRWYYYCTSGTTCQGDPVIGSNSEQISDVSCNSGNTCNHPLNAGGGSGDVHVGIKTPFKGMEKQTGALIDTKHFTVHADFVSKVTLQTSDTCSTGCPVRLIRVLLVTGKRTYSKTPLLIAQQLNPKEKIVLGPPASATCYDGVKVWKISVEKKEIAKVWENSTEEGVALRNEFASSNEFIQGTSIMDHQ